MALLKVSGGEVKVPALFLGGIIKAGDLIDEVNHNFKVNGELLTNDPDSFFSRPIADLYKVAHTIFKIAEVSCEMNDIEFSADEWLNRKTRPTDIEAIYTFFFALMRESGFGAQGETEGEASTTQSNEDSKPKKSTSPQKSK